MLQAALHGRPVAAPRESHAESIHVAICSPRRMRSRTRRNPTMRRRHATSPISGRCSTRDPSMRWRRASLDISALRPPATSPSASNGMHTYRHPAATSAYERIDMGPSALRESNISDWDEYANPFPPFSNTPNPIYSAQTGMLLSPNADTDAEAHPGLNHLPYARRRDMNTSGPAAIAASPPVRVPTRPDSRTFETYSDLAHLPCVHQHDTMPSTATSSMPSSPAYAPTRPDSRKLKSAPVSAAPHRPGRHAMTGRCGNTP